MDKDQVAAALTEIGTLLEIQGENAFRCNACHNGALAISQYEGDLDELVRAGQLGTIRLSAILRDSIPSPTTPGTACLLPLHRACGRWLSATAYAAAGLKRTCFGLRVRRFGSAPSRGPRPAPTALGRGWCGRPAPVNY
jgi:hypothetical protein